MVAVTAASKGLPSAEEFEARCQEAGIKPDKPLFGLLAEVRDIVEIASDAVRGGARGLTAEGEAKLVSRIERTVEATLRTSSERHRLRLERRASWIAGSVVAASLVVGGAGGGWLGWEGGRRSVQSLQHDVSVAFQSAGPESAAAWLNLMRHNDPQRALQRCMGVSVWTDMGRTACLVPLWIDNPGVPEKGRDKSR
jgi:hypothetical protein